MTLFVCWAVFPLLLAAICLGCGLAVSRISRTHVPPALLLPVGYAAFVVIGLFATLTPDTARLTLPVGLAVAAVGIAASLPKRLPRVDPWLVGGALAVFAVFAAPVVLSGEATFAGYIKLDDTATFLAIADRALEHGRSLEGLSPSSYEAALAFNLHFYPLGSLLPLGAGWVLTGEDAAWLFQPYLAFLAALLALVLYHLAALVVASRAARAAAAVLGAQAALLYGYALWGGVKELAAAPLVALVAALTGGLFAGNRRLLGAVPLVLAAAALVGVLSIGAAAWLFLPLGLAALALFRGGGRKLVLLGGVVLALVLPSLAVARFVLGEGVLGSLRNPDELGNLIAPLSPLQLAGIWPSGDFRVRPGEMEVTYVLLLLVALLALAGIAVTVTRRVWEVAVYTASAVAAALAFALFGSPWLEAKAFAIGSPVFVFSAVLGCAALVGRGRRVEGFVALAALTVGVVWSNALAYREVNLAPRAQLAELERIGEDFAGAGPALMTEYQPYGVRHFLRKLDAEGASELRRRPVFLADGSMLPKGGYADLTAFGPGSLTPYRTLVLRRSPVESRPPADFQLAWAGRFYEVWQRRGDAIAAPAIRCRDRAVLQPLTGARFERVAVPRAGLYDLWVGGSIRGELTTYVDGRRLGSTRHQLNLAGMFVPLGRLELGAGDHVVELRQRRPTLRPGTGGPPWPIGPLALSPADRCAGAAS